MGLDFVCEAMHGSLRSLRRGVASPPWLPKLFEMLGAAALVCTRVFVYVWTVASRVPLRIRSTYVHDIVVVVARVVRVRLGSAGPANSSMNWARAGRTIEFPTPCAARAAPLDVLVCIIDKKSLDFARLTSLGQRR